MSGSSPWNDGGFSFSPNTNTLDANTMPSDKAEAARQKAKEIMLALEDGKPGDADKMMGAREPKGNVGIIPIDWLKTKFGSKKDKKKDEVVR